jgi:hypothetical protein
MALTKEHQKIKMSLLKAVSKIQEEKRMLIAERISNLPFLSEQPETKVLKEKINATGIRASGVKSNLATERPVPDTIKKCFTHGYTSATHSVNGHATTSADGARRDIESVFNPYGSVNPNTSEIAISAVAGRNYGDFYVGQRLNIADVYYLNQVISCGTFSQQVAIASSPFERLVTISVHAVLPPNYHDVVKLVPGLASSTYRGIVGAEGYLDIYTGTLLGAHENVTNGSSNNFLHSWKDGQSVEQPVYKSDLLCSHSFILPAGATTFWINAILQVNAFSAYQQGAPSTPLVDYALIDLRGAGDQSQHILRESPHNTGADHHAPGAAKITSICYTTASASVPPNRN